MKIPDPSLVLLIGASGAGKSTFARRHFGAREIISSDECRALVANDENDQGATGDAFEVLHQLTAMRLRRGLLTVIDATNVQREARRPLLELARRFHLPAVAIVFNVAEPLLYERRSMRADRHIAPHALERQLHFLDRSLDGLAGEGFRDVHVLRTPEQADAVVIERVPLAPDRRGDHGPFDIIGDVHGCHDELLSLLSALGCTITGRTDDLEVIVPVGRRLVFVGDLVDRGPATPDVLRLVMTLVDAGAALCVPGNHDNRLMKKLNGRDVRVTHGLAESLAQLEHTTPQFRQRAAAFIEALPSHLVLDGGRLVVAHAGMKASLQGRDSKRVRDFALYGDTTGQVDEFGLPVRRDWAAHYDGAAAVVYGHTPVLEPVWVNNTINIDTGCVFGGRLTALRWPERELVSVPARRVYTESLRPFHRHS